MQSAIKYIESVRDFTSEIIDLLKEDTIESLLKYYKIKHSYEIDLFGEDDYLDNDIKNNLINHLNHNIKDTNFILKKHETFDNILAVYVKEDKGAVSSRLLLGLINLSEDKFTFEEKLKNKYLDNIIKIRKKKNYIYRLKSTMYERDLFVRKNRKFMDKVKNHKKITEYERWIDDAIEILAVETNGLESYTNNLLEEMDSMKEVMDELSLLQEKLSKYFTFTNQPQTYFEYLEFYQPRKMVLNIVEDIEEECNKVGVCYKKPDFVIFNKEIIKNGHLEKIKDLKHHLTRYIINDNDIADFFKMAQVNNIKIKEVEFNHNTTHNRVLNDNQYMQVEYYLYQKEYDKLSEYSQELFEQGFTISKLELTADDLTFHIDTHNYMLIESTNELDMESVFNHKITQSLIKKKEWKKNK